MATCLQLEEISWRQKSRVRWVVEGDHNTSFFHCLASQHRRNNFVSSMLFRDKFVEGNKELGREASNHFARMYEEEFNWRPSLDGINFCSLDESSRLSLEGCFSEDEIFEDLRACKKDKASGPDGFNMGFLQEFWDVVKDIVDLFNKFHRSGSFVKSLNSTFIVLVLKLEEQLILGISGQLA